jgi:hypothetical protein
VGFSYTANPSLAFDLAKRYSRVISIGYFDQILKVSPKSKRNYQWSFTWIPNKQDAIVNVLRDDPKFS